MVFWLVTAKPRVERLGELRRRLDSREISRMRPFGRSLENGLVKARLREDGIALWEEEDYCVPPLAQERAAVLDYYFDNLTVEDIGDPGQSNSRGQQPSPRSEEHTSELQSRSDLVCRLLLEKKKKNHIQHQNNIYLPHH